MAQQPQENLGALGVLGGLTALFRIKDWSLFGRGQPLTHWVKDKEVEKRCRTSL
jgi:hypothetical protein